MAIVRDVMTEQVFNTWPHESAADALGYVVMFGLHALPVLDPDSHEPVGVVSVSDLTGSLEGVSVSDRMSTPAVSIVDSAALTEAARCIERTGLHHLVVTDREGAAVGFLSAVDVVSALLSPSDAPGPMPGPGLEWSALEEPSGLGLQAAPSGPGMLVLLREEPGRPPAFLWAESAGDVRARLDDLASDPPPRLARYFDEGRIRFRAASADARSGAHVLRSIARRNAFG